MDNKIIDNIPYKELRINKYSVYELWVMGESSPFYGGKGVKDRPYSHLRLARNGDMSFKSKKIRKALSMNLPIIIKRVFRTDINEEAAEEEKRLIALYGRRDNDTGSLTNHTNGGEGTSGFIVSEETRRKIGNGNRGKIISKETRQKMSNIMSGKGYGFGLGHKIWLGKTHSEESKLKISTANKGNKTWLGRTHSEESKLKMSIAAKNRISKPLSETHRQNISKALKGKPFSDEHRLNATKSIIGRTLSETHRKRISESSKGRVFSEETRRKISLAIKGKPKSPVSEETRIKMRKSRAINYQTQRNLITIYKILGINEGD